jgi:hypothetical protein
MDKFKVGDLIQKIGKEDDTKVYSILSIKEDEGGNWHDGFTISMNSEIEYVSEPGKKEKFQLFFHFYGYPPEYKAKLYNKPNE